MEQLGVEMRRFSEEAKSLGSLMGEDSFVDLRFLGRHADSSGRRVWVAWSDGSPRGLLVLDPRERWEYEITLAVPEGSRRQGIGSRMLDFARSILESERPETVRTRLVALVDQRNETALAFFERHHGFVRESTGLLDHAKLVLEL